MNVPEDATAVQERISIDHAGVRALVRRFLIPAVGMFLLVHFPARLLAHLSISRSGFRDYWPHPLAGVVVANLVLLASFVLVEGALIAYVSASARGALSMENAFRRAFARFPHLVLARLLYFVIVALGGALFVVPGVAAALLFSMHAWVVITEDKSAPASLYRSFDLVRGRLGSTFRCLLPATLASLAWLACGFFLVALLLRAVSPFPVCKLAPLAMAIVETGIIVPVLAAGTLFYRYRAKPRA